MMRPVYNLCENPWKIYTVQHPSKNGMVPWVYISGLGLGLGQVQRPG